RVTGEPRTRHAVGMADRDRAAVDVELFRVDAELVAAVDHLHGKSFVELPKIDVIDLQPVTLEQARHREHRSDAHLVRLTAGGDKAAEYAERLEAAPCGLLVAHDHRRAGPVRQLAGIAGGDGETFTAHRLERGNPFG